MFTNLEITHVWHISTLVKDEIKCIVTKFVVQVFRGNNYWSLWGGTWLVWGKKNWPVNRSDVNDINQNSIYPSNCTQVTLALGDDKTIRLLRSSKTTTPIGSQGLFSSFLGHGAVVLIDAFSSLMKISFSLSSLPDCWRPVPITSIPKFGSTISITGRIHFIVLPFSVLTLRERALLECLRHSANIPVDTF